MSINCRANVSTQFQLLTAIFALIAGHASAFSLGTSFADPMIFERDARDGWPMDMPADLDMGTLERAAKAEVDVPVKRSIAGEKYNYAQVLSLSLLFFEAQRSGKLPASNRVGWRGDSCLKDGADNGLDLTGGWFDGVCGKTLLLKAGDHLKFALPMSFSATVLSWGLIEYATAWTASGELSRALDGVKWGLDWIMKAHPKEDIFYAQVGDGYLDHNFWGPAELLGSLRRPSFAITPSNPGSETAGEAAAALAAGSAAFKSIDIVYSAKLMHKAKSLFSLAYDHPGTSSIAEPYYKSWTGYKDELAWAAAWLYVATGEKEYLDRAESLYDECCTNTQGQAFSWDGKAPGVQVLLHKITRNAKYGEAFSQYMEYWLNLRRTPKGLAFYNEWAPLRYAANTAFLGLVAADYGLHPEQNREFAKTQLHYILGDCCGGVDAATGQPFYSYVIGYGEKSPRAPHHRGSSCTTTWCQCGPEAQPHILYGALVGGPGSNDEFEDRCDDYIHSEVATDYNAGFTSAVAGMKHLSLTRQLH